MEEAIIKLIRAMIQEDSQRPDGHTEQLAKTLSITVDDVVLEVELLLSHIENEFPTADIIAMNTYQMLAYELALPASRNEQYLAIKLGGEAGEALNVIGKHMRGKITYAEEQFKLKDELGDVLWYLAGLCSYHKWTLSQIAIQNLAKLNGRKKDDTL